MATQAPRETAESFAQNFLDDLLSSDKIQMAVQPDEEEEKLELVIKSKYDDIAVDELEDEQEANKPPQSNGLSNGTETPPSEVVFDSKTTVEVHSESTDQHVLEPGNQELHHEEPHLVQAHDPEPVHVEAHHEPESHVPEPAHVEAHHEPESHVPEPTHVEAHHEPESHVPEPAHVEAHHEPESHVPEPTHVESHHKSENHIPEPAHAELEPENHVTEAHVPEPESIPSERTTHAANPEIHVSAPEPEAPKTNGHPIEPSHNSFAEEDEEDDFPVITAPKVKTTADELFELQFRSKSTPEPSDEEPVVDKFKTIKKYIKRGNTRSLKERFENFGKNF